MVPGNGSICGAIPSSLFTRVKSIHGFDNMHNHAKIRLTSVSIDTNKNPTYASYCYEKLTNLSLNNVDTRILFNRELTIYPESANGIGVRYKIESSLFESIYTKQMVGNLCASQKYHKMDIFLTFLCNQVEHLGLKNIRNFIDYGIWNSFYKNYFNCTHVVQK